MPIDTPVRIVPSVTQLKTLHRFPITPCYLFDKWDLFWWSVWGSTTNICCSGRENEPGFGIINRRGSPAGFQTSETNDSYFKRDVFYGYLHWGRTRELMKTYEHFWEPSASNPRIVLANQRWRTQSGRSLTGRRMKLECDWLILSQTCKRTKTSVENR